MDILSIRFLLLAAGLVVMYFLVPKRFQWPLLLAVSLLFYCMAGVRHVIYILITASSTYGATRIIQGMENRQKLFLRENKAALSKEEKTAYKEKGKSRRKAVMVITLLLNFGILCAFKYFHFALEQVNSVIGALGGSQIEDSFNWIIPLGISFYTFQSMGYLLDVYWGRVEAENNYFKVLLFVTFFPQITQGPISNFKQLTEELFAEHSFSYRNYSRGCQRMMWGFFKKMVVANVLSIYTGNIFANYGSCSGLSALAGMFMYSVEIYADFSGYMDIMCGLCGILGIRLMENFERPYFSKSVAEYWRRWHHSLGEWFKNYLYYPLAVARWNQKLGRNAKEKFGKAFGNNLPATLALIVVWFTTGLWHGASWAYIVWGGLNGAVIIFSLWMEQTYEKWKSALKIKDSSWGWRAFQTVRTFTLVTFIKALPEVGTLSQGVGLWKSVFAHSGGFADLLSVGDTKSLCAALAGTLLIFVTSLIQRRQSVRSWLEDKTCLPVRILLFAVLFIAIVYFGVPVMENVEGGFIYAEF